MNSILFAVITQSLTFLPLALGISISYNMMRATDMTLDGSFVIGAGIFARLVTLGYSPALAAVCALLAGAMSGIMVSLIQRGGRIDPLLAGILAIFILTSANLVLMGRPNISLLSIPTLFSSAFAVSEVNGWLQVAACSLILCTGICLLIYSRFGLYLRALGNNPDLLLRHGKSVELYRMCGFSLTNMLAASAGILTAQVNGYADINMGAGMTLTGIGAILIGRQLFISFTRATHMRTIGEFIAVLFGVMTYFLAMNALLRFNIDPVYLKMILGMILIFILRNAVKPTISDGTL